MHAPQRWALQLTLLSAALAACGGGGDDGAPAGFSEPCVGSFLHGTSVSSSACTACGSTNNESAIDGFRTSYASHYQTGGTYSLQTEAPASVLFQAGNFAGALMRIPASYTGAAWTISTYRDGALLESRTPGNASGGDPATPGGADEYYGFVTTLDFDGVAITLNGGSSDVANVAANPIRVYEFCGQR